MPVRPGPSHHASFPSRSFIGPHRVVALVATGTFGEIYRARDRRARRLAVKVLRAELVDNEVLVAAFRREAALGQRVRAPGLVPTIDTGTAAGRPWFAMPFVAGRDLSEVLLTALMTGRPLPVPLAVHVAAEVCAALEPLHSLRDEASGAVGLVHRDIAPANLRITPAGEVKLLDLGSARFAGEPPLGSIDYGRWSYAAPEQVRDQPTDPRADVFSMGALLHEMLTMRPLLPAERDQRVRRIASGRRPPPPSRVRPMPAELDALCAEALALDPAARLGSVRELDLRLRALIANGPSLRGQLARFVAELFPADRPPASSPAR
jgi:serine/threonine protein kinase